ncbi:Acyl-CoA synthetase member 2 mitochondrial [Dimargaris xerosporica]|nr:Acyl-CoA synthetase member 2 mitochondrial [Dimargaris xerosporica]
MEAKVVDVQTRQVVAVGERGELYVRGIYLMQGYWGNLVQTRQAIDKDGWLHTGDIAEFDSQGFCRIVDRKKDMIIKGGVNIFPGEIEQCLAEHPDVQSAAVVGVPHDLMEEQVCACIIVKDKAKPLTTGALRRYCKGRISPFKIPSLIVTLNAFPKTSTGKVLKPRLVQLASLHLKSTQRLIAKSSKFRPY